MARARSTKNILPKLVENTSSIVYLLQPDGTILFSNQAFADWVGLPLDAIVGATLTYSSELSSQSTDRLAGTCPPPGLLVAPFPTDSERTDFLVTTQHDSAPAWRKAHAIPLFDSRENDYLILVVGSCRRSDRAARPGTPGGCPRSPAFVVGGDSPAMPIDLSTRSIGRVQCGCGPVAATGQIRVRVSRGFADRRAVGQRQRACCPVHSHGSIRRRRRKPAHADRLFHRRSTTDPCSN